MGKWLWKKLCKHPDLMKKVVEVVSPETLDSLIGNKTASIEKQEDENKGVMS